MTNTILIFIENIKREYFMFNLRKKDMILCSVKDIIKYLPNEDIILGNLRINFLI